MTSDELDLQRHAAVMAQEQSERYTANLLAYPQPVSEPGRRHMRYMQERRAFWSQHAMARLGLIPAWSNT